MSRPALTYHGGDVAVVGRRRDDHAVVAFLDREGKPTGRFGEPWPWEIRGLGWHIAEVKRLVAAAPVLEGAPDCHYFATAAVPLPMKERATQSRGYLFAHFAAMRDDE